MRQLMPMAALVRSAGGAYVEAATKWGLNGQRVPISTMRCLIP